MYKSLFISIAVSLAALQPIHTFAAANQLGMKQTVQQEAWLGIALGTIPGILRSQLSAIIPAGQGVMVTDVAINSPAAKAGLQKHDVILNSGNQKIYSPEQLTRLVRATLPDNKLDLTLVRQGKIQNISITLGTRDKPVYPNWQRPWPPFGSQFGSPFNSPYDSPFNSQSGQRWSMPSPRSSVVGERC